MKKSEITKQRILSAAESEFAEKGIFGARVDRIAEQAGVNKRMLYAHFTNKEKLYSAVLTEVYSRITILDEVLFEKQKTPTEFIEEIIGVYFDFLYQNSTYIKLIMWENLNEAKYLSLSNARIARNKAFDMTKKYLEKGIKEKIFKADIDIDEVTLSINMFCFSSFSNKYTMSYLMDVDYKNPDELKRRRSHIVDVIMSYIKN